MRLFLVVMAGLTAACLGRISLAADHLVQAGTTETSAITLADDDDMLTVESGGTLSVTIGDAAVTATGDDFLIANEGLIEYLDFVAGGIWVSSSEGGIIRNEATGVISSTLPGIFAENSTLSILNEGSITGEAAVHLFSAEATVINSGSMNAFDVAISSLLSAVTIDNSGSITGVQGINVHLGTLNLFNSGEIEAFEYGVRLNSSTSDSFVNTGLISGDEEGVHQHETELKGRNSGTIRGGETGFSVHDSSTLDFENSGTITGDSLYGLQVYDELIDETAVARLINSGAISGGEAGVHVENAELELINTGSIEGGSYGIHQTGTDYLTLVNAGRITGSDYSLSLDGSGNSVTLLAGSNLEGDIHLGSADNSFMIGNGLNALLAFDDTSVLPATIDTNGMPFVMDSARKQIAVVDPTGFAMADEMLDDLAGPVLQVLSRCVLTAGDGDGDELSAVLGSGEKVFAAGDRQQAAPTFWAESFGSWREQDDNGPAWSSNHRLAGVVTGINGVLSDKLRGGVFLGGAKSALAVDDDAQDIHSTSFYGGLYLSHEWQSRFASAALLAGWQENDSRRHVANNQIAGGLETAEASYDALFLVPEVTFGKQIGALISSLSARYAGLFINSYSEEGSTADLTVAAREVHSLAARLQLALPEQISLTNGGTIFLEPRTGLVGRVGLGEGRVSAELLDSAIPGFDPGGDDPVVSVYTGAVAIAQSASGRARLKFSADVSLGTDRSVVLAAGLGGEIGF